MYVHACTFELTTFSVSEDLSQTMTNSTLDIFPQYIFHILTFGFITFRSTETDSLHICVHMFFKAANPPGAAFEVLAG